MSLATIRKALASLVGVTLMVVTAVAHVAGGFLPPHWLAIILGLEGGLTTISTWLLPNDTGIEARPVVRNQ